MSFDTYAAGLIDIGGVLLRSVANVNENPNVTLLRRNHSGRIYPIYSATGQIAPGVTFDSLEAGIILDTISEVGISMPTTVVYYTKRDPTAVSVGAGHLKSTFTDGIIVPRTLGWAGGSSFWVQGVEIAPESSDGLAGPITFGTDSLPAHDVIPETYTGGKIFINDEEVETWQNATLDFGLTVDRVFHKGLPAPARCAVRVGKPTLRFSMLDPTKRGTVGQFGQRIESCNLFLRRNAITPDNVVAREADNEAVHVKIAMVGGIVYPGSTAAPEEGDDTQEFMLVFDETDATQCVTVSVGQSIPA